MRACVCVCTKKFNKLEIRFSLTVAMDKWTAPMLTKTGGLSGPSYSVVSDLSMHYGQALGETLYQI